MMLGILLLCLAFLESSFCSRTSVSFKHETTFPNLVGLPIFTDIVDHGLVVEVQNAF